MVEIDGQLLCALGAVSFPSSEDGAAGARCRHQGHSRLSPECVVKLSQFPLEPPEVQTGPPVREGALSSYTLHLRQGGRSKDAASATGAPLFLSEMCVSVGEPAHRLIQER